jgi:protein gp37
MTHRLEAMGQEKYAGLTVLNPRGDRYFNGVVRCHDDALQIPLRWKKPRRIFVNSMSDLFHKDVPFDFIDRVWAVMACTQRHTYQILTKRPDRAAEYFATRFGMGDVPRMHLAPQWYHVVTQMLDGSIDWMPRGWAWDRAHDEMPDPMQPLPNVWIGTSVENQQAADERIPHLLKCPAAVRFISAEPLLGPIDLAPYMEWGQKGPPWLSGRSPYPEDSESWVIVGGESGPDARRCNVKWIGDIVAQCKAAGVPVFVKQLGAKPVQYGACDCGRIEHGRCHANCPRIDPQPVKLKDSKGSDMAEWPEELRVREFPKAVRA